MSRNSAGSRFSSKSIFASLGALALTAGVSVVAQADPIFNWGDDPWTSHLLTDTGTLTSVDEEWDSDDVFAVIAAPPPPNPALENATVLDLAEVIGDEGAVLEEEVGGLIVIPPEPEEETDEIVAPTPPPSTSDNTSSLPSPVAGSSIVETALSFVGYPYVYAAANPAVGFDCSGFTSYVYGLHGISLPRTAAQQGQVGTVIPASQAQPGDLVAWTHGGHVAIYLGGGQIVHASTPATGVKVGAIYGSHYFIRL